MEHFLELLGRPRNARLVKKHWFLQVIFKVALLEQVHFFAGLGVEKWLQSGPESSFGAHKIGSENHTNLEVGKSGAKKWIAHIDKAVLGVKSGRRGGVGEGKLS